MNDEGLQACDIMVLIEKGSINPKGSQGSGRGESGAEGEGIVFPDVARKGVAGRTALSIGCLLYTGKSE